MRARALLPRARAASFQPTLWVQLPPELLDMLVDWVKTVIASSWVNRLRALGVGTLPWLGQPAGPDGWRGFG